MVHHDEAHRSALGRLRGLAASPWSPLRFDGRLGRADFLAVMVGWHLVSVMAATVALGVVLIPLMVAGAPSYLLGAALVVVIALAVVAYALGVASYGSRRLHDMGRSARWMLLGLVPVVGFALGFALLTAVGTPGPNAYGEREGAVLLRTEVASGALPAAVSAEVAAHTEAAFEEGRRFAERDRNRGTPPRLP